MSHSFPTPQNANEARLQKAQARRPPRERSSEQLPPWPDSTRGVPNVWLRCALFAGIQGKGRQALKRELLATVDGVEIRFSGWQLDQSDLDVWETVIHLARHHRIGNRVQFSEVQVLKTLKRSTGTSDRLWLRSALVRLAGATIEMKYGNLTFFGALLKGAGDEMTGVYVIELESRLEALYMAGWTQIEWGERVLLRRKPLALWLHGWFCSHAEPFPLCIETIQRLSGSVNSHPGSFKRQLSKALDELVLIGALVSWRLSSHRVCVIRIPTPSQQRHLIKKKRKGGL
ncbi:plasmid replication initiator TrfA [Pseudomonas lundensis]|uniref:plasmid replication initiator TrfA n=1 Tax=Pseudomonas lundensis TaxID=86185 RepID=UPI001891C013|nr:plasmid replication initiator TrfA [Pseudomonas lundensis]QOF92748.1 TrfA family protein [Pseudomonas lundensis]